MTKDHEIIDVKAVDTSPDINCDEERAFLISTMRVTEANGNTSVRMTVYQKVVPKLELARKRLGGVAENLIPVNEVFVI